MNDKAVREALAQTLYEEMTSQLRLWGDLEHEQRQRWLHRAAALLPVVREIVAEELREAAAEMPSSLPRAVPRDPVVHDGPGHHVGDPGYCGGCWWEQIGQHRESGR